MQNDEKKYLGSGLSFPLKVNARGGISLSSGSQDIEQAIGIILSTRPGERVMRPNFGCGAHELLFEPRDAATMSLLQEYVLDALRMWEPRIQVLSVDVSADSQSGGLLAEIEYMIKATHDTRSIVHPFFIEDEPEIY